MIEYPALIDGEDGAWGVSFPDLPGIVAMGHTVEEALSNARDVLRDCAIVSEEYDEELAPPSAPEDIDVPPGCRLAAVALVPPESPRRAAAG